MTLEVGGASSEESRMFEFMTTDEVATWLKVSPSTLCRWRQVGQGPRVTWLSPACPRYRRSDVEAWLDGAAA